MCSYDYSQTQLPRLKYFRRCNNIFTRVRGGPICRECRLVNRLFRHRSKKISKHRVTGLCEGNPPVTGGSPHKGSVTQKMLPYSIFIFSSGTWSLCISGPSHDPWGHLGEWHYNSCHRTSRTQHTREKPFGFHRLQPLQLSQRGPRWPCQWGWKNEGFLRTWTWRCAQYGCTRGSSVWDIRCMAWDNVCSRCCLTCLAHMDVLREMAFVIWDEWQVVRFV